MWYSIESVDYNQANAGLEMGRQVQVPTQSWVTLGLSLSLPLTDLKGLLKGYKGEVIL